MNPSRILILKPSAIGDVVHTLPILNLLRRRWPAARIEWLATPPCAALLRGHPQLDEVIVFERRRFGAGWWNPAAAWSFRRFMADLRRRRFDLVLDLQGLFRSGFLSWCTRAPHRVGFANAREGAWLFYTQRVEVGDREQHAIERYLTLAESVGCGRAPVVFDFGITDAERAAARQLAGEGPYVVLLPGASWPTKRWPAEHFAALVEPLRQRGLRSIVAGAKEDQPLAAKIPGALDLAGRTSLKELVALLERAAVVVANDSGPMHIASALGRPLAALFGPTSPIRTGPYRRPDCVVRISCPQPCFRKSGVSCACMRDLPVSMVLEAIEKQLHL